MKAAFEEALVRIDQLNPSPTFASAVDIPAELMDSVIRHQAHLAELIVTLRNAGVSEEVVEASVRTLVDSYADELTIAIRGLMRERHRG